MASPALVRWIAAIAILTFLLLILSALAGGTREVLELHVGLPGLLLVVQLSDLHVSSFYLDRSQSLSEIVGSLLAIVNPALVLITGDLTDGKSADRLTMRQDEGEWSQYNEAILSVVRQSGMPLSAFFDLRGNHDKFGVPEVGGSLDFFSKYSISAMQNRTGTVQSVTVLNGGWRHVFVGLDSSMEIGLRGPSNLFGHPRQAQLEELNRELSQWDDTRSEMITKVVFGHFPTSFISYTEKGRHVEEVFAKHNVSAYVCGHLHYQFGRNLFKHHQLSSYGMKGEFWEWEMGDWKQNKVMRIIAIDEGHTTFHDLDLVHFNISDMKPLVFPTYPLDSRTSQRATNSFTADHVDSIRALIFSSHPIMSVIAKLYDAHVSLLVPVEELEMKQSSRLNERGLLFVTSFNSAKYVASSATRFLFIIEVRDSVGQCATSKAIYFSVNGKMGKIQWSWKEYFVMGLIWVELYKPLLWIAFLLLASLLLLPKLYGLYMSKNKKHSKSISLKSVTTKIVIDEVFVQWCSHRILWWGELLTTLYLLLFPWLWGVVLTEGYSLGHMSIRGWSIKIPGTFHQYTHLGVPDIMVIVLPFIYYVILPLYVLIFLIAAERSFTEIHIACIKRLSQKEDPTSGHFTASERLMKHSLSCKICQRWPRKFLYAGCLGIAYAHAKKVQAIVGAYGSIALVSSPAFTWAPPVLILTALQQTSKVNLWYVEF